MEEEALAGKLIADLATALQGLSLEEPGARDYVARLVVELRAAALSCTPRRPDGLAAPAEWQRFMAARDGGPGAAMLDSLQALTPTLTWLRADHFYPEPENAYFAERLWGAMLVGQDDAQFLAEERYIALLMMLFPHTTYPLHAHRIEELYFVLSGEAEWTHDGESWSVLPPGSAFHNHSYQPHAIRAGAEPMVAVGLYLPPFGWENELLAQGDGGTAA